MLASIAIRIVTSSDVCQDGLSIRVEQGGATPGSESGHKLPPRLLNDVVVNSAGVPGMEAGILLDLLQVFTRKVFGAGAFAVGARAFLAAETGPYTGLGAWVERKTHVAIPSPPCSTHAITASGEPWQKAGARL